MSRDKANYRTKHRMTQMSQLSDRDTKITMINMLKDLEEKINMLKDLDNMYEQMVNFSRANGNYKKGKQ